MKYSTVLAESRGQELTRDFNEAFVFARSFRDQLIDMKKKQNFNRQFIADLLLSVTEGNKKIIGFYTLWEPNSFDGKDSEYSGKPLHDASGRLNVYTYRSQGKVSLGLNEHYEKEGLGDYYLIPKKRQKETMMDPYLYPVDGQDVAMVSIIVPIMSDDQFLGIVGVDISIADIQKQAQSIKVYETGYASLIANNGTYASHPNSEILLKPMPPEHGADKAKLAIEEAKVSISEHYSIFLNTDVTQVYLPIKIGETGQSWVMSTVVPTEEIMAESKAILMLQLVFGIIISVSIVGLISWIVSKVNSQLKMIASSLGHSADEVTSASKSVADTGTELSSAATEQAAALQETVSVVDEINSMIGKTAENAQRSIVNAQKSQKTIGSGKDAIQDMLQSMNLISDSNRQIMTQVEKNNSEFAEIMQVINEIENKTKVINDIVFQTKLLSFNASVEAARAGEHGKGFAVVAEEVGNLAMMSGNAAKEIRTLLDASTRKVQEIAETSKSSVSHLINEGQKALDLGNKNVQRCQEAFVSIETDAKEVGEMIHEISSATQEQARGVEEMSKAMTQIDQMTQQNAGGAQQSASAAEQLTQQAVYLNSLVQDLLVTIEGGVQKETSKSEVATLNHKKSNQNKSQSDSDWEDLKAS